MTASKKLMDNMLIIAVCMVALLAWFDSRQVAAMKLAGGNDVWDAFWNITSPAFFYLSLGIFAAIALVWFLYSKDKSESLALFLAPSALVFFGFRDVIYYIISPDTLADVGCWADVMLPIRLVSDFIGEACPTGKSLLISAALGSIVAYYVYRYLKEAKW